MIELRKTQKTLEGQMEGKDPHTDNGTEEWATAREIPVRELVEVLEEEFKAISIMALRGMIPLSMVGVTYGLSIFQLAFEAAAEHYLTQTGGA